jgi:hypothetical protein
VFKPLAIIGRCPLSMDVLAQEIKAFKINPEEFNDGFLENGRKDFYYIPVLYG